MDDRGQNNGGSEKYIAMVRKPVNQKEKSKVVQYSENIGQIGNIWDIKWNTMSEFWQFMC